MLDLTFTYLPNVEKFVCPEEKSDRRFFGSKSIVPKNININLKALKKLKMFDLDLSALVSNKEFECLFIHFRYPYGCEDYCSVKKKEEDDDNKNDRRNQACVVSPVTVEEVKGFEANNEVVRIITMEIDKIEQLNMCHDSYISFAQLQHGVNRTVAPEAYIDSLF